MSTPVEAYQAALRAAQRTGAATEHSYRPALKALIEALGPGITAVNEPRRRACGAPDIAVVQGQLPLGHIEAKDVGMDLDREAESPQLRRYRDALNNLILTDYLEFRWYVGGVQRLTARLETAEGAAVADLLRAFLQAPVAVVRSPEELARRMAGLGALMRVLIAAALTASVPDEPLRQQLEAFRRVLLHGLTPEEFADMYAQTICYGLFTARCLARQSPFTRERAAYELPKTNPFMRRLFGHIAGPELDERVAWAADDLARLLDRVDLSAVLAGLGRGTGRADPVFHFYETFLAAYDAALRERRGVFYTPGPVVSFIVHAVDDLLRERFGISAGIADSAKVRFKPAPTAPAREYHRVLILDPAAGTGTFLHEAIARIRQGFPGGGGAWPAYVREHLLPRIFGFELLMAPYAVAHLKLGLELAASGYDLEQGERLRFYLTNALEEPHATTRLPLFAQWLADEARAAGEVKTEAPVMVILGNPPYSGNSANRGEWITSLLHGRDLLSGGATDDYFSADGRPLAERNPKWLNDDYVKFIRFAQWRIERTGQGILAFVTNNGYLDNPTFRGMRQSLMRGFDEIYLLNLHGDANKRESPPGGGRDQNVFDIRQGVAIGLFVRRGGGARHRCHVRYADLWGPREEWTEGGGERTLSGGKYHFLSSQNVASIGWRTLAPSAPSYLFIPRPDGHAREYEAGWPLKDAMPVNVLGFQSHRDHFAIAFTREDMRRRIGDLRDPTISDADLRYKYGLTDNRDWTLARARREARADRRWEKRIIECLYRPLDRRWCYFSGAVVERPRNELLAHVAGRDNLCLNTMRQTRAAAWRHALVSDSPSPAVYVEVKDGSNIFPLYLYSGGEGGGLFDGPGERRRANFAPAFTAAISERLDMEFDPVADHVRGRRFGPGDLFGYIYGVLWCPGYQERYLPFLKADFPRIPLTGDPRLFRRISSLGRRLAAAHLGRLEETAVAEFPVAGSNRVERLRYEPATEQAWINDRQFFSGISARIWGAEIGAYAVAARWLKDRQDRSLAYDDLSAFRRLVAGLAESARVTAALAAATPRWPLA